MMNKADGALSAFLQFSLAVTCGSDVVFETQTVVEFMDSEAPRTGSGNHHSVGM